MKKYPKIGIRPTIDGRQGGVRDLGRFTDEDNIPASKMLNLKKAES